MCLYVATLICSVKFLFSVVSISVLMLWLEFRKKKYIFQNNWFCHHNLGCRWPKNPTVLTGFAALTSCQVGVMWMFLSNSVSGLSMYEFLM